MMMLRAWSPGAGYDQGVLTITVPVTEQTKSRRMPADRFPGPPQTWTAQRNDPGTLRYWGSLVVPSRATRIRGWCGWPGANAVAAGRRRLELLRTQQGADRAGTARGQRRQVHHPGRLRHHPRGGRGAGGAAGTTVGAGRALGGSSLREIGLACRAKPRPARRART